MQSLKELEKKGIDFYRNGNFQAALDCLDNLLITCPACHRFQLSKGLSLIRLERYKEASDLATTWLKEDKNNFNAHYILGLSCYYTDDLPNALLRFTRALKIDPNHKDAQSKKITSEKLKSWNKNGIAIYKAGMFQKAYEIFSEVLKIDPANKIINSRLYKSRAACCMSMGNLHEAIEDFTKSLKLNPKFVDSLIGRARCHSKLENYEEAIKDYEDALKLNKTGELEEAIKSVRLQLKRSKSKDYYKILGVPKTASEQEIKAAYRKLALAHHPDRHANSSEAERKEEEEKFKKILEAYNTVVDPSQRAQADKDFDP